MTYSQRIQNNGRRFRGLLGAAVIFGLLTINGYAQAIEDPKTSVEPLKWPSAVTDSFSPQYLAKLWRAPLAASSTRATAGWDQEPALPPQRITGRRQRSTGRKILGAIVGATGGFFAGGYIGAKIEGDCNCDDPGFKGAIIGAPIGAVTGGILGYKFLF